MAPCTRPSRTESARLTAEVHVTTLMITTATAMHGTIMPGIVY